MWHVPGLQAQKGLRGKATTAVTPQKNLEWNLDSGAEFRSPSETKAVPSSVRNTRVTGSQKKAKPNEKQMLDPLDPKVGYQSQLKQLEARMKEQLKQIQHQVTGECHPVPTSLLVTAVSVAALASECPQTRARQLTEINFGSADVGVGYGARVQGRSRSEQIQPRCPNRIQITLATIASNIWNYWSTWPLNSRPIIPTWNPTSTLLLHSR